MTSAPPPWVLISGGFHDRSGQDKPFNALARHPEVYLAPSKGLYYFDAHFDPALLVPM